MSIIRSTHQIEGLITLDNVKQIAVFSDFDSAVLFRAHHPAWEVHIHLVLPRAPQTPPTSTNVSTEREPRFRELGFLVEVPAKANHTQPLRLRQAQASSPHISAYLTDGETIYKQAIFTQEQLGLANQHAQDETDGLLYWEQQPIKHLGTANGVVEEAILTNPAL